jgi:hypothetical protein
MTLRFEITVNDETPVMAGGDDVSVLTSCLTFVPARGELDLQAGGLVTGGPDGHEHVEWIQRALRAGDRVCIRVVDGGEPSAPISRRRDDPRLADQRERAYYERLKKRYEPT